MAFIVVEEASGGAATALTTAIRVQDIRMFWSTKGEGEPSFIELNDDRGNPISVITPFKDIFAAVQEAEAKERRGEGYTYTE